MVYPYHKDKYALELLDAYIGEACKVREVKQSKFGKLLHKQAVKSIVTSCGDGMLRGDDIRNYWTDEMYHLRLTLDEWGEHEKRKTNMNIWNQVSRPEKNLVLQVNFDGNHDQTFFRFMGRSCRNLFSCQAHPIHAKLNTLGWVRMDINLDGNEVLIEEVQTDWVRKIKLFKKGLEESEDISAISRKNFRKYLPVARPYLKMWDEMLLASALWFIRKQLGINRIWYHSFESSTHYKMMDLDWLPPRSVYTALPEKFGFDRVSEMPDMIRECKGLSKLVKCGKHLSFYKLEFKS